MVIGPLPEWKQPKPEPVPAEGDEAAAVAPEVKKPRPKRPPKPAQAKKPDDGASSGGGKRGLVPKVPLKTS